jgi:hypothetical protein
MAAEWQRVFDETAVVFKAVRVCEDVMRLSSRLIVVVILLLASRPATAQEQSGDGVFAPPYGVVWKDLAGPAQWEDKRSQGYGPGAIEPFLSCEVDAGTPFTVKAIVPGGVWIEVTDGPEKGCSGVAMNETVQFHDPAAWASTGSAPSPARAGLPASPAPRYGGMGEDVETPVRDQWSNSDFRPPNVIVFPPNVKVPSPPFRGRNLMVPSRR